MEINMEPLQRQILDDGFDAFTMLANGSFVSLMHVDGGYQVMRAVVAVLRGSNGKPSLIGGVTFNEGLTDKIDAITILPNKKSFQEDLKKILREEKEIFALQVGISQFFKINRVYGYTYGNRILQEIAWLIQESVEKRGKVYRMDGANFVILTDKMTRESIAALYDHIRYKLQSGIEVNGVNNTLMAGGGLISIFNSEVDVQTICSCLKYAYEESENVMHGELVDFNGSIRYEDTKSLEIINAVRESINNDCVGFNLEYIPIIDVKTKKINGTEAVIFWGNEKYGKISSENFLPILENDFIFEELGDFIFYRGFSDGKKFLEKNPNFYLCVNVYRLQLESDYFVENLLFYLKESGFPSELLRVKFTGNCRHIGLERMRKIISGLHEQKILAAIDDFGSGSNSIEFLRAEPIDAVSIDKKFIEGINYDEKARNILKSLAEISGNFVSHINITGVDNEEIQKIIETLPVTTVQGDYFSKPVDVEEMLNYLIFKSSFHLRN